MSENSLETLTFLHITSVHLNAHVIILIRDTDYGFIPCFPNFLLGGCVLAKIVQSEFYCFVLCNSCHLLANQYAFLSPVQRQWAASSGLKWRGVTFLKRLQLRKYTAQLARFIQSQFNLGQSRFKLWSNKTEIPPSHHGLVTKEYLVLVIDDIGLHFWRIGTFLD